MNLKLGAVALLSVLALTACEVQKTPVPTGGSRADATVEMSYNIAGLEVAVVDWEAAEEGAKMRCNAWGYRNTDAFEGTITQCQASDFYGNCNMATVKRVYQCTN